MVAGADVDGRGWRQLERRRMVKGEGWWEMESGRKRRLSDFVLVVAYFEPALAIYCAWEGRGQLTGAVRPPKQPPRSQCLHRPCHWASLSPAGWHVRADPARPSGGHTIITLTHWQPARQGRSRKDRPFPILLPNRHHPSPITINHQSPLPLG